MLIRVIIGLLLGCLLGQTVKADQGLFDWLGNPISTHLTGGASNPIDFEYVFAGSVFDLRGRVWTLSSSTDSAACTQSGAWTTGRTWTLSSAADSITSVQGTSPWVDNITQFGGANLSTGTGASGTGIPRVTVSNDSNILATQSGVWTVQQGGTPTSIANGWPVKLTDGTNTAAIKPASTAPLATDTSVVVALSSNGNQATSALQTTGNASLSAINTLQSSGGQKTQVVDASGNIQPVGDVVSRGIWVKVGDGTDTANVSAASSPPVLSDTALEVTQRPDWYGSITQTSVSCAATSTTVLAAATATLFISIRNPTTSAVTIWVNAAGAAAVVATPSLDLPPGAMLTFSAQGPSFLPSQAITCISSGAASSVAVFYK